MDHKDMLKEAARLINERGNSYGNMVDTFTVAAKIASLNLGYEITPYETAQVMAAMKDARCAYDPSNIDSHIDGINYRLFAAELAVREFSAKGAAPVNQFAPKAPPKVDIDQLDESMKALAEKFGANAKNQAGA